MDLNFGQKQKIRNAFESILRADYVSINDLDKMSELDDYYIDFYRNSSSLLQRQDNFISGRRGTGKTALLLKGYYECLKTISKRVNKKSEILGGDKVLPIYIDLSKCKEIFSTYDDVEILEIHFVRQIIIALKKQLELIFEEKFLSKFIENPSLESLDYIEQVLVEGITISDRDREIQDRKSNRVANNLSGKLATSETAVTAQIDYSQEYEVSTKHNEIRGLDVQSFLNKVDEIRKKAKIDYIYFFADEFSDLTEREQKSLSILIKKFLGSKINMFFKIGVISDRYNFSDDIIIGRDLFQIPLDLNDFVERYGGIVTGLKKIEEFTQLLVSKRIEIYCPELKHKDIFKTKEGDLYHRLARATMGIPRSIGLILQNAWLQCDSYNASNPKIGFNELNYGIRATRKMYYKQFKGSVQKRLIPGFYMDLWGGILSKAISEKNNHPTRPASHILIDPIRKHYMNILCENFIVHHLEEDRTSKYGGNYSLYSIDYDLCQENGIKYAENKDEFTSVRFIYDNVLSKYDPYFFKG